MEELIVKENSMNTLCQINNLNKLHRNNFNLYIKNGKDACKFVLLRNAPGFHRTNLFCIQDYTLTKVKHVNPFVQLSPSSMQLFFGKNTSKEKNLKENL